MKDILQLSEFFVEGKDQEQSHVLLHITEPSTPEEHAKGYFFAIAEITNGTVEQIEHLQQMIDDLETGYYETDDEEDKNALEITLEYINRRGHHVLKNLQSQVHCLVGTIRDGDISFAYHGDPTATVFYRGKNGYEEISVIGKNDLSDPEQLFSALIQGQIQTGDYFYIATPQVEQYISPDRLLKIITSRPIKDSTTHIQKVLAGLRCPESFGGILFNLTPKDQLPKTGKMPPHLRRDPAGSLNRLISAQEATKETLHPPILGKATNSLRDYFKGKDKLTGEPNSGLLHKTDLRSKRSQTTLIKRDEPQSVEMETNHRHLNEETKDSVMNIILVGLGKALVVAIKVLLVVLQSLFMILRSLFVNLFLIITNKGGQRVYVIQQFKNKIKRKQEFINALPLASKILLLATLAFGLIFFGSILFLKTKEARAVKQQAYLSAVEQIVGKKDEAQSSMIYGDDERAFNLLQEAKQMLSVLPQNSKDQKNKATELNADIEAGLMRLRKIVDPQAQLLADLTTLNPTQTLSQLAIINEKLIAFGADGNTIYLVDKDTGSVQEQVSGAITGLLSASTPKENDYVLFLLNNGAVATLNKDTFTLSSADIAYPKTEVDIANLFVYNRRVYTIDRQNNQIYKHNPIQTGFDRGTDWLTDSVADLSNAVSLSIDGDLYALKENGEILKFVNGKIEPFAVSGLDPVLDKPSIVWTYNNVNNLYILEPTNRRLVVLTKEGKLIKQYSSPSWINPTGMIVDEENNRAWILDNNKIYKFDL